MIGQKNSVIKVEKSTALEIEYSLLFPKFGMEGTTKTINA